MPVLEKKLRRVHFPLDVVSGCSLYDVEIHDDDDDEFEVIASDVPEYDDKLITEQDIEDLIDAITANNITELLSVLTRGLSPELLNSLTIEDDVENLELSLIESAIYTNALDAAKILVIFGVRSLANMRLIDERKDKDEIENHDYGLVISDSFICKDASIITTFIDVQYYIGIADRMTKVILSRPMTYIRPLDIGVDLKVPQELMRELKPKLI